MQKKEIRAKSRGMGGGDYSTQDGNAVTEGESTGVGGKKKEGSDTSTAVREGKGGEMTSASEPVQLKDFK